MFNDEFHLAGLNPASRVLRAVKWHSLVYICLILCWPLEAFLLIQKAIVNALGVTV